MSRKKKRSGRQRRADKAQIKSLAASGALRCHVEALEARLLLSAEPLLGITSQDKPLDAEGWVQAVEQSLVQQSFPDLASAASAAESDGLNAASPSVVLFIDATVAGAVELAESVPGGARVVLLDAGADGIAKITAELSQSQDLDSIQIISHGASGMLQLGGTTLAAATLDAYADDLAAWGRALSDDGDLLFFGCNVAAGQRGQDFLSQVALYTSADVAASVNLSGSAALGGDWNLEASVGQVDATSAIAADVVDAAELLLITVNLGSTVVHPTEGFGYGSTIDGFGQAVVPNSRWPASGNIPPSASFQLAETKAFTQEFWFFPRPKLNAEEIYAEEIYWWTADQIRQINAVGVVDGGTGLQFNTMVGTATLTNVLNPDAWNHISQTYDGTRFTIFINGVEEFTTDDFAGRTPAEPDSIRMRGNPGAIDELRVWNTARSQAEIQKSMLETLTGTESGLVGYWQFEEDAAVSSDMLDRTGRGSHLQSVNFEVFNDPAPQIGYVDVMLSQEVDNGIGLFVAYQISAGSTADEDVDFLSSRFRTDSEDKDSETLGIIIPNQEIAGRIYFMARPDAIFEPTETIKISLSEPPFTFSNSTYDVGLQKTQTINIIDNGAYTPGFAVTDAFGRSVTPEVDGQTSQPLYYDQTSKFADLDIKLTSQPVGTVDLLITAGSNTYFAANTGETVTLTFTPTDWDVPQRQRLSLLSPATEAVFTIRRFGGTAPEYLPAGIKQFKFTKETSEGQVEEGCPTVPLVPALSIVAARDATEGDGAGALFEILLDAPAPPTGLIVPLLNGGQATAGEDFEPLPLGFFIEPGAQRAELPITIINDWIDEETETLTIELVETNEYKVVDANRIATVQITDDDLARIAVSNFTPLTPPSLAAEPSDTFDTAIDVGRVRPGQLLTGGKFDQAGDVDLLRFTLDRSFANLDTATLTFYEPNGDIGYRLYDAAETLIDSQFISSSQTEREVTLSLLKPSGEYFLEVFGVASSYDIKFVGSDVEPNNDFASAIDLGRVEPGIAFAGSLASPGDVDIYRFTIDESIARFDGVTLNFSHQVGDLALELYNANQTSIGFENSSSNRESIGFPYDSAGVYFVRVTGQPNSYNIELEGVRGDTTPFGVFANSYAPIVLTEPTTTAEIGQFGIRLESEPTAPATLTLTSQSDGTTSAGTLSTSSLTFTPANWNQYQLVAVTPLDDPLPDGDQTLTVTATGWSNDAAYLDRTLVFDVLVLDNEEFQTSDVTTRVESSTLPKARLSGTGVSVAENPNGSTVTFGVELSKAVATETLVGLQFDDVSAVLGADFEVMSGVEVNWRDQTESTTHPLAGINITGAAAPAFVDIDGDGDQDLFVGVESGELRYFRNIGTASNPVFEERTSHPLSSRGTATLGGTTHPAFADVDRDGDYDLLLGSQDALTYYRNEGTATQPRFPFPPTTGADNPFAVVSVLPGRFYAPTFADIDGDGDQDLFVSSISSLPSFFRNEGNGSFVEKIGADNPAGALNTSATLTTVGSFTGGDVGEGLDLDGNFLYAVNVRGPAAGPVRDATFTADNAPGVAVTARYDVLNWHGANFGSTTNDNNLEIVMQSIRYETTAQGLRATLANLTPGTEYQLQLLFAESCCDRGFDIFVEGQLAVDNFSVLQTQGGVNNPSKSAVVTHQFVATDTTLDIFLSGLDATFPDRNPTLSGMTLEALGTTSNTTTFVDVDRDGDLDAIRGWATGMVVRENTGSPTSPNFTTASISRRLADVAATISQSAWAAFDLNGDGQPELVAGDPSDRFHIFSSNLVAPIATGQTSATVQLKILDDLVDETDPLVDETDPLIREGKSETIDVTLLQSRDYILDSSTAVRDTADVDQDGDTDEFITPADFIGSLTIIDNDVAAILVEPPTGTTLQEVGSSQTLRVSLATQPLHDVTVFVASSDATEALITTAANSLTGTPTVALTFKPDTWNLWQSVQVVSVDDLIDDGDRTVTVRFSSTGEDLPYRGEKLTPAERPLLAPEIAFMNADNDSVGITVIGPQEAVEGQDNVFSVVLNTQPMGQVRVTMTPVNDQIRIATARPGDPVTLEFDENNWDIAQLVQVTALDDGVVEYLHESRIQFDIETAREIDGPTVSDISTAEQAFDLGDITGGLNWTNFPFRSLFTFDNGIPTRSGAYFRFTLKQPGTELEQIRSFNAVSRSYLTLYERGDLLAAKPAIATTEELKSPVISLQDLEAGEYLLQVRSGNIGDAGLTIQFDSPDRAFETLPIDPIRILIKDNDLPTASLVAGPAASEVFSKPSYFAVKLNVPAPAEIGDTGIKVHFQVTGGRASLGDPTSDKHDYSILADHFDPATETGWVRVAPGDVQANIGIVPVDDKRVEDLALTLQDVRKNDQQLTVASIAVAEQGLTEGPVLTAGTVIQGRLTDGNEIEFTIKKDTPLSSDRFSFTEVEINIAAATFAQGNAEFRQFKGVVKSENIFISLLHDPDVPAYQLPLAQDKQGLNPFDPAVQANPANFDAARVHAEMTLFDDDVPGIRIVRLGDDTSIGEGNTAAYGVSLISEPSAPVTVVLTPNREIALSSNVAGSLGNGSFSPVFDYQLDATDVPTDLDLRLDSLLRTDQGWTATFDARLRNVVFDGSDVDLTLSAESAGTSAAVSFDVPGDGETDAAGRPLMGNWNQFQRLTVTHLTERFDASGAFFQLSLNLDGVSRDMRIDVVKDVDFAAQTVSLTFDSSNWADLQPLTVRAVPDATAEPGDWHEGLIGVELVSPANPKWDGRTVATQSIRVADRQLESGETANALSTGFGVLEDSLLSLELPLVGSIVDFAPQLSDFFSETLLPLVESIESQAALTVTTFKEIAESALNKVIVATNGAFLDTATVTPSATEDEVTLLLELHKTWNLFDLNLASDFGVEGLGLEFETTGSLGANITFDLAFGLGLHKDFGFYIDTDLTGVTVDARLDLNGFAGKGSLGFLQLDFADDVDNPTALSVVFEAGLNDLDNYQTVRFFDVNGDGLLAEEEFTYGIGDDLNPKDDKLDVGPDGEIIVTTTSIREPWVNLNKQGNAVDVVAGDFPTVLEVAASSLSAATAVNWNDNTTFDEAESIINEGKYRSRSQGSKTIFYFDANNNGKLDIGKRNVDPFSVLWSTLEPSEKNKSEIWVHSTNTTWVDSQGRVKEFRLDTKGSGANLAYYFNENGGSLDDASEQISTKLRKNLDKDKDGRLEANIEKDGEGVFVQGTGIAFHDADNDGRLDFGETFVNFDFGDFAFNDDGVTTAGGQSFLDFNGDGVFNVEEFPVLTNGDIRWVDLDDDGFLDHDFEPQGEGNGPIIVPAENLNGDALIVTVGLEKVGDRRYLNYDGNNGKSSTEPYIDEVFPSAGGRSAEDIWGIESWADHFTFFDADGDFASVGKLEFGEFRVLTVAGTQFIDLDYNGELTLNDDGIELEPIASQINEYDASAFAGISNPRIVQFLNDGDRLTLSELINFKNRVQAENTKKSDQLGASLDLFHYSFAGEANLGLTTKTSIAGSAAFPSFSVDLAMNFPLFNFGDEAEAADAGFTMEFNNVTMDLGSFLGDFAAPILETVDDLLAPIKPIIKVLNADTKLPGAIGLAAFFESDGRPGTSLLEVAQKLAGGADPRIAKAIQFANVLTGIVETIDSLNSTLQAGDKVSIEFGDFSLSDLRAASDDDANSVSKARKTSRTDKQSATTVRAKDANGVPDSTPLTQESGKAKKKAMVADTKGKSGAFNKLGQLEGFDFALFNPDTVLSLLMGETGVDLITYDVPDFAFQYEVSRSFQIWGPIAGLLEGGFDIGTDLSVGFDTAGFEAWADKDFAFDQSYLVFDGFYLDDWKDGVEKNELYANAYVAAGAGIDVGIASGFVRGGVEGTIGLDLVDTGERAGTSDGKIRGSDIVTAFSNNPLDLFQLNGVIEAFLGARIDVDFFFFSATVWEQEFARFKIAEFTLDTSGFSGRSDFGNASTGPVSGATIFYDANNNGLLDQGEPFALTDIEGGYSLNIGDSVVTPNGTIRSQGGIDVTTGLPVLTTLEANLEGHQNLTAFTTLAQFIDEEPIDVSQIDFVADGVIDERDRRAFLEALEQNRGFVFADYNADSLVAQGDFDLVLAHWGEDASVTGVPAGWINQQPTGPIGQRDLDDVLLSWGDGAPQADLNGDGVIDEQDADEFDRLFDIAQGDGTLSLFQAEALISATFGVAETVDLGSFNHFPEALAENPQAGEILVGVNTLNTMTVELRGLLAGAAGFDFDDPHTRSLFSNVIYQAIAKRILSGRLDLSHPHDLKDVVLDAAAAADEQLKSLGFAAGVNLELIGGHIDEITQVLAASAIKQRLLALEAETGTELAALVTKAKFVTHGAAAQDLFLFGKGSLTGTDLVERHGQTDAAALQVIRDVVLPPIMSHVDDFVIAEDQAVTDFEFTVFQFDTPGEALHVSVLSDNPELVPAQNVVVAQGAHPGDRLLRLNPVANAWGQANLTLIVTGRQGQTLAQDFMLTVNPVNDAPVAVDDTVTASSGLSVTFDPLANDSDADGSSLRFGRLMNATQNGIIDVNPDGTLTYRADVGFVGEEMVRYLVSDGNGGIDTADIRIKVDPDDGLLRVVEVTPTASGVDIRFNRAVDGTVLNLYDIRGPKRDRLGPADVVLKLADLEHDRHDHDRRRDHDHHHHHHDHDHDPPERHGEAILGSLVIDGDRVSFIATGGPLAEGPYQLTLRSAENGFRAVDTDGLLDGNNDGSGGDDFTFAFAVNSLAGSRVLSLGDFARGPGQDVDLPAAADGLPLLISNAEGVEIVQLKLLYDPSLLSINGVRAGDELGDGAAVGLNFLAPGVAELSFAAASPLGAGAKQLFILDAEVPADAPYGAAQVLRITESVIVIAREEIQPVEDWAVHVNAYAGDADGDAMLSARDLRNILRVSAAVDEGFTAYPTIDPVIIADVTGNGRIDNRDAFLVNKERIGVDVPEVPNIPTLDGPVIFGAIPAVNLPPIHVSAWTNPDNRLDVSGDGHVNGHDLALIAQTLRRDGERVLNAAIDPLPGQGGWFWDVNGDEEISQADFNAIDAGNGKNASRVTAVAADALADREDEFDLLGSQRASLSLERGALFGEELNEGDLDDFFADLATSNELLRGGPN